MDINVKNVSALIHFMEALETQHFDMNAYTHDCDTPSCALGWACTVPALRAVGLWDVKTLNDSWGAPEMARRVFGVYEELFSAARHAQTIKSPKQWATHARKFLADNGLSVVPAEDGFISFMESVLKPAALGEAVQRSDAQMNNLFL